MTTEPTAPYVDPQVGLHLLFEWVETYAPIIEEMRVLLGTLDREMTRVYDALADVDTDVVRIMGKVYPPKRLTEEQRREIGAALRKEPRPTIETNYGEELP